MPRSTAAIALMLLPLAAPAATSEEIALACGSASAMSPAACSCVGTEAAANLSPLEQDFVLASLLGDAEATAALRRQMSEDSVTRASVFLIDAPARCAAG